MFAIVLTRRDSDCGFFFLFFHQILSAQQTGLGHLTKTLTSATEDVDVMKEAFGMTTPKQLKR